MHTAAIHMPDQLQYLTILLLGNFHTSYKKIIEFGFANT